jgi:hypothetical protein
MRAGMGVVVMAMLVAMPLAAQQRPRPAPPPADQIAAPGRPGWTVDATNGCWVWHPNPKPGETVRWYGGCPRGPAEGQGRGESRWAENGAERVLTYVGTRRAGREEGRGVVTSADGSRYDGEWRDGRPHGRGVLVLTNGFRHEGEYRDGQRNGHGVASLANGSRYEGNFRDGRPDGFGTLTTGSDTYSGTWAGGCFRDGQGRRAWAFRPGEECP